MIKVGGVALVQEIFWSHKSHQFRSRGESLNDISGSFDISNSFPKKKQKPPAIPGTGCHVYRGCLAELVCFGYQHKSSKFSDLIDGRILGFHIWRTWMIQAIQIPEVEKMIEESTQKKNKKMIEDMDFCQRVVQKN